MPFLLMKKRQINFVLNAIGIFLITISIIRLFFLQGYETFPQFFWLCNHVPLLIGIAILFRSSFWLMAEVSFLFVGMFLWIVNFLSYLLIDKIIFVSAEYIFVSAGTIFFYLSVTLHLLTLPLAIIAIFLLKKPEPLAWKGSLFHGIILIPIMIYFGESYNLNLFLRSDLSFIPNFTLYPVFISIIYFGLFVIPTNWLIVKLLKIRKNQ